MIHQQRKAPNAILADRSGLVSTTYEGIDGMNTTALAARNQPDATTKQAPGRSLYWMGGNLGLGERIENCTFTIEENGVKDYWTVEATFARLSEFSKAAQTRILEQYWCQLKYS